MAVLLLADVVEGKLSEVEGKLDEVLGLLRPS